MFTEEQETYLGDILAERVESDFKIITDEKVVGHLRKIGARLVAHLPENKLNFRFYVVDLPEVNAFAVAGGRIYITKKLVGFLKSEDELAGIIGHELGHAIVHHSASDFSYRFRKVLGINSVGDKADIYRKYNQYLDTFRTKKLKIKDDHEGEQQLEADKIGLYAMVAAGYDPEASVSAWDRIAETKGDKGSVWSDLFGRTSSGQKRLRALIAAANTVSEECIEKKTEDQEKAFAEWRSYVVTKSVFASDARTPGLLKKRTFKPKLIAEIKHFQFSPDGKYLIAQDTSNVHILTVNPLQVVFSIPAKEARNANFSPDSKSVSIQNEDLRVEKWDIDSKQPMFARELYFRGGCWKSAYSPDGNFFACYTRLYRFDVIDVRDDRVVYTKDEFFKPDRNTLWSWSAFSEIDENRDINDMQIEFSPDGTYMIAGFINRGLRIVSGRRVLQASARAGKKVNVCLNLRSGEEIKISGDVDDFIGNPFAFYGNDKIIGQHFKDPDKSGIITFPDGKRVEQFYMQADSYSRPYKGDYLVVRPTATNPAGIFDVSQKKFIIGNKTPAIDAYGSLFISEGKDGVINLFEFDSVEKKLVNKGSAILPQSELLDIHTVDISPNLEWLTASERTRGAVWNAETGDMKVYIRGFRRARVENDGKTIALFPKIEKESQMVGLLDGNDSSARELETDFAKGLILLGKYSYRYVSKEQRDKPIVEEGPISSPRFVFIGGGGPNELKDYVFEMYDTKTSKLLWKRDFEGEIPRLVHNADTGNFVAIYTVESNPAKKIIKADPELSKQLETLDDTKRDVLIQAFRYSDGALVGQILMETGKGSFFVRRADVAGDYLAVADNRDRVQIYSLKSGDLISQYFGYYVELNHQKGIGALANIEGELKMVDLKTEKTLETLKFPSDVVALRFDETGEKFLVLTSDQTYYLFRTEAFTEKRESRPVN
ncbi:MAG: M48 family metallopeptidase [Pyrinomonadaceae bacterium]